VTWATINKFSLFYHLLHLLYCYIVVLLFRHPFYLFELFIVDVICVVIIIELFIIDFICVCLIFI
jgi:hypothetical protein